ncbi:MAG: hypothetical protein RI897_2501 [Verrucomicrobiota bacterium]
MASGRLSMTWLTGMATVPGLELGAGAVVWVGVGAGVSGRVVVPGSLGLEMDVSVDVVETGLMAGVDGAGVGVEGLGWDSFWRSPAFIRIGPESEGGGVGVGVAAGVSR